MPCALPSQSSALRPKDGRFVASFWGGRRGKLYANISVTSCARARACAAKSVQGSRLLRGGAGPSEPAPSSPLELLLRLSAPAATKRLRVSGSVHHSVCPHHRWRCRPGARPTHSSHIRIRFRRAALGLWNRKGDTPTGASVTTLYVCRARRSRWRQRGLGRRPLPQHLRVLQAGLGHWPHVRLEHRPRLTWTELDSSRRQCEEALT